MGKTKEQFIERYGGFQPGETPGKPSARTKAIDAIYAKIENNTVTFDDTDKLAKLKREPDDERNYQPHD